MFVKLSDPVLDRGIIDGTQSDALYILTDQVLKFFQEFLPECQSDIPRLRFYIKNQTAPTAPLQCRRRLPI